MRESRGSRFRFIQRLMLDEDWPWEKEWLKINFDKERKASKGRGRQEKGM